MTALRFATVSSTGMALFLLLLPPFAQGQPPEPAPSFTPPGPPPLPPGLNNHDRALPPGRPFDGGGFIPPGRSGNVPPGPRARFSDWTAPGMAASNPHGYGSSFGEVWVGSAYQPRARRASAETGSVALGFGLGDPERHVGAQVSVYSFSTLSDGFGERSGMDLQLHRVFANGLAVAIGRENIHVWGGQDTRRDSGSSRYAVGSRVFSFGDRATFSTVMFTLGVGDGRFQSEQDFWLGKNRWNVFGSAAVRVARPVSLIAEWTGQDLLIATSLTPLRNHRLGITLGYTDVTRTAGDGARIVVGMSFTHDFGRVRTD